MTATFWQQALAIAGKELRVEWRAREVLYITVPFGAVALLLVPLALGPEIQLLERVGPGMFWAVVLLFGMLVTLRQTSIDGPAQQDLLAMLGLEPAARFAGRAVASGVLLLAFELLLAPLALILYNFGLAGWPCWAPWPGLSPPICGCAPPWRRCWWPRSGRLSSSPPRPRWKACASGAISFPGCSCW